MIRSSALALAAATAAATVAALPAPSTAAGGLPGPALTTTQVRPSSCPSRDDDILAYSRRPTLRTTAGALAARRLDVVAPRMEFEVREAAGRPTGSPEAGVGKRLAGGTVRPVQAGGATFTWRPAQALPSAYELAWRARVMSAEGPPVTTWSSWRTFFVEPHPPFVRDCTISPEAANSWEVSSQYGISEHRLVADEEWLWDFYGTAWRIRRFFPKAYVSGEVDDSHIRRGWIAFRGDTVPPEARAKIARFVELNPASRVAVLTGRNYSEKQLHTRLDRLYERVRAHPLVGPMSGGVELRNGVIELYAERAPGSDMSHRQIADKVLADVAAEVTAYRVVKAGGGVLAGPEVQPVRLTVGDPEPPEEDPWG